MQSWHPLFFDTAGSRSVELKAMNTKELNAERMVLLEGKI
jgi:hypothetical protein